MGERNFKIAPTRNSRASRSARKNTNQKLNILNTSKASSGFKGGVTFLGKKKFFTAPLKSHVFENCRLSYVPFTALYIYLFSGSRTSLGLRLHVYTY